MDDDFTAMLNLLNDAEALLDAPSHPHPQPTDSQGNPEPVTPSKPDNMPNQVPPHTSTTLVLNAEIAAPLPPAEYLTELPDEEAEDIMSTVELFKTPEEQRAQKGGKEQ